MDGCRTGVAAVSASSIIRGCAGRMSIASPPGRELRADGVCRQDAERTRLPGDALFHPSTVLRRLERGAGDPVRIEEAAKQSVYVAGIADDQREGGELVSVGAAVACGGRRVRRIGEHYQRHVVGEDRPQHFRSRSANETTVRPARASAPPASPGAAPAGEARRPPQSPRRPAPRSRLPSPRPFSAPALECRQGLRQGVGADRFVGDDPVRVEYHPRGYPVVIEIGSLAADAGVRYSVGNVQRLR
jgi:hypothetical protein